MIVALIPAHNEAGSIADTLRGLASQTVAPDRIIVVADNCSDRTEEIAASMGAEVFSTVGNTAKKAGALNQGINFVMPTLADKDVVLVQDADSVLCPEFIEKAVPLTTDRVAVSGAYVAMNHPGIVPLMQRTEFIQERRRIARRQGRVNVLSGVATTMQVGSLRRLSMARGTTLPGVEGEYYDESSLTEDFEITLALKMLGVEAISPKNLPVLTDVMPNFKALWGQRLRWQRGTLETLTAYPLSVTWKMWVVQVGGYAMSLMPLAMVTVLALMILMIGAVEMNMLFLACIPIFVLSEALSAKRGGWRTMMVAGLLIPNYLYGVFRFTVYWKAAFMAFFGRESAWT